MGLIPAGRGALISPDSRHPRGIERDGVRGRQQTLAALISMTANRGRFG